MIEAAGHLRRLWGGLALIQAALWLHLILYLVNAPSGRSTAFLILAAAAAGMGLLVIVAAARITPECVEVWRKRLAPWQGAYVGVSVGLGAALGLGLRPEWVYAHMAAAAAATFALGYWTLYDGALPLHPTRRWMVIAALAAVAVIAVRVLGLSAYPELEIVDEPWVMSWAISYLRVGHSVDWIRLGVDGDPAYYLPRFAQVQSWWLGAVGIGLWEGRLFSYMLTLAVIGFTALAARNLYGRSTAVFTIGALFSSAVLMFGARIRHDIGLALALAISLWLHSEALKRRTPLLHLAAGVVMGWGFFCHYNAAFFGVVMVLSLYGPAAFEHMRAKRGWPGAAALWYGLGGLLGGGSAVAVQILPDVAVFMNRIAPRAAEGVGHLLQTTGLHISNVAYLSRLELILIALGLGAGIWRRDWVPVLLVTLSHIALGILASVPAPSYVVPLAPFYGLLVARLFSAGFSRTPNLVMSRGAAVTAGIFVVILLGSTLSTPLHSLAAREPLRPAPPPAAQWVLDNLPPETTILGDNYYYLWLHPYRYASVLIPDLLNPDDQTQYETDPNGFWDRFRIEVIIDDRSLPTRDRFERLDHSDYIASRGFEIAAEFENGDMPIIVYRRADQP